MVWDTSVGGCGTRTRIVKVASTPDAAAVALVLVAGIVLPLLPFTASLLKRRAWPARRSGAFGAAWPRAAGRRAAKEEANILVKDETEGLKKGRLLGYRAAQGAS